MGGKAKTKAPETTHREAEYLKQLVIKGATVAASLSDGSLLSGKLISFDQFALEIQCKGDPEPRLIMKEEITTLRDATK